MIQGQSYNPNEFRGNLPDSIKSVSPDLYAFLRDTLLGLRQFNTDALHGALRIPESELITRYIDEVHPINSKAAIRLSTGQTAFGEFLQFPDDPNPNNEGRLIFRRVERIQSLTGTETEFAGIDYTRQGAGRYGWVVYGGYAPIPTSLYSGPQPALFGVLDGRLSEVPSLKFGSIRAGLAFLTPAFGVPGDLDEQSLADLIDRLAETESLVAELRADIATISATFGQFQTRNLIALSRLESRTPDERLNSVFAEFLQQRADLAAFGRQIAVEREFLDSVTGNVIAYANAAQRESVVAQSFSKDSLFWATVSQESTLSAQAYSLTSQSSAQISQTASVSAGESAAQALAAVSAMASIGSLALTENGGFETWDDPLMPPDSWELVDTGVTTARVPGFNSAFAIQFTKTPANVGFHYYQQTPSSQTVPQFANMQPGWYVVEIDVRLDSGSFFDDAVWIRSFDDATYLEDVILEINDLQAAGIAIGAGTPGRVYQIRHLFQLTNPMVNQIQLFIVAATPGNTISNQTTWDRVDLRVASQAEVATQTVLTSVVTQVASLNSQVALLVTENGAQATSINTLTAQTTLLNTTVAGHTSQLTALTDENAAQATSITSLTASFTGLNTTVAGHTTQISALATENASQASAITGLSATFTAAITAEQAARAAAITDEANARIAAINAEAAARGTALTAEENARIAAINAEAAARAAAIDTVSASIATESTTRATADSALASQITTLTSALNGNIASVTALASAVDGLEARYGVTLDVNGSITGFELLGGGGTSAFNITADNFRIRTSSGNQTPFAVSADRVQLGTDLHVQNHQIIFDNGSIMRVQGTGFGASGQFLDWAGPSGHPDAVTELTAIQYLRTDGSAFFGGSLASGVRKNAAQSTQVSATAQVTTGPFGSDGGQRVVVIGYNSFREVPISGACNGSGTPSVTIELLRNGAVVATYSGSGSTQCMPGLGPSEPGSWSESVDLGWTFTDNSGGTNIEYLARVISRPLATAPSSTIGLISHTQRLSVQSLED